MLLLLPSRNVNLKFHLGSEYILATCSKFLFSLSIIIYLGQSSDLINLVIFLFWILLHLHLFLKSHSFKSCFNILQEAAEAVKNDFGSIDILVHSLANGPEVQ